MNDFVGNILQNKFYACHYILLSGTRPKRRCTPICGAAMLLRCNWCRNLTAVNCILQWTILTPHAANGHYIRNNSCITFLWLHHNHKMPTSYHRNGLVSSHQSVGRWLIFMCFVIKIFWGNYLAINSLLVSVSRWNSFMCIVQYSLSFSCIRSCRAAAIGYGKWCFVSHVQCCGSCMVSTEYST